MLFFPNVQPFENENTSTSRAERPVYSPLSIDAEGTMCLQINKWYERRFTQLDTQQSSQPGIDFFLKLMLAFPAPKSLFVGFISGVIYIPGIQS